MARLLPGWWSNPPTIARYAVAAVLVGGALAAARWMEANFVGAPAWIVTARLAVVRPAEAALSVTLWAVVSLK